MNFRRTKKKFSSDMGFHLISSIKNNPKPQIQYFSNSAEVICFAFIAIVRFNKWIKLKSFYLNSWINGDLFER